jgi:L-asparaginase II
MVRHGLDLPEHLLALSASSHSGERFHLAGVRAVLAQAGLDESVLQTPADFPLDPRERDAWIADGRREVPIAMNCSGKHAAMLATCVLNDWPTDTYRSIDHPLQQSIRWQVEALAGEQVEHIGVDGCGAPVLSLTLAGLARSMSRAVQDEPDSPARRVTAAMRAFPDFVGGTNRDVTAFMLAVPGLVAKDGAEGVYVAALPDGTSIAIKSEDGSERARQVALASILVSLGADPDALAHLRRIPLLGGGSPVGEVSSPLE